MSRKDTIIIAVLINAGLLALLFTLAVNTDEDKVSEQSEMTQAVVEVLPPPTPAPSTAIKMTSLSGEADEVDSFLKELSSDDLQKPIVLEEEGEIEIEKEPLPVVKPVESRPATTLDKGTQYVEVTIKRGDALEKIARSNGTTVEAIKKANNMTSNKLTVGKVLKVPVSKGAANSSGSSKSTAVAETSSAQEKKETSIEYYTIKSGDNPWKIAKQYKVGFDELLKLNGLNEEKARNLKAGDRIRVR